MSNAIYARPTGALPLSIGTSLALESIFLRDSPHYDPNRKPPQIVDLMGYTQIYFNVETLIRNLATSVKRQDYEETKPDEILNILNNEIEVINSIFQVEGRGICKPVLFVASFKSCRSKGKNIVSFRESTTEIQKAYDVKLDKVLKLLDKSTDSIVSIDSELKPVHTTIPSSVSALIMTHYPYDLTSFTNFRQLHLLESHTGLLKKREQWNTKYAGMGETSLAHLPFHRSLLYIFGDSSLIAPQPWNVRKKILDISIKAKWNPFTSFSKIKASCKEFVEHPADLDFLMRFLNL